MAEKPMNSGKAGALASQSAERRKRDRAPAVTPNAMSFLIEQ
jgi:hypothetical protein